MTSTKIDRILQILKTGSLNRFEAERIGDHCLPSTISILKKKGYPIESQYEKVKNRFGSYTQVKRYWLESETIKKREPVQ